MAQVAGELRIRNVLSLLRALPGAGAEIRLHPTTLYNSIYRADDELLINTHVFGNVAGCAPVRWQPRGDLLR